MNNNLKIHVKYQDLMYYTNNLIKKFPKYERNFLTSQISKILYLTEEYILYSEKEFNNKNKLKYLNRLDVYLSLLKSYIRMSYRYKYISINNYETFSIKITEISNMLGGWIKSCLLR